MARGVAFNSVDNQTLDVVLGFIHDKDDKRVGMRVWNRETNTTHTHLIPVTDWEAWNLSIVGGRLESKLCNLSDFPILYAEGDANPLALGAKLYTRNSGAWVLDDLGDGRMRLISTAGQIKVVTKEVARAFASKYKIANGVFDEANNMIGNIVPSDVIIKEFRRLVGSPNLIWVYMLPSTGEMAVTVQSDVKLTEDARKDARYAGVLKFSEENVYTVDKESAAYKALINCITDFNKTANKDLLGSFGAEQPELQIMLWTDDSEESDVVTAGLYLGLRYKFTYKCVNGGIPRQQLDTIKDAIKRFCLSVEFKW